MKDLTRMFFMIGGIMILTISVYLLNTRVSPVVLAYAGIAGSAAIILFGIFFWRRGKDS